MFIIYPYFVLFSVIFESEKSKSSYQKSISILFRSKIGCYNTPTLKRAAQEAAPANDREKTHPGTFAGLNLGGYIYEEHYQEEPGQQPVPHGRVHELDQLLIKRTPLNSGGFIL